MNAQVPIGSLVLNQAPELFDALYLPDDAERSAFINFFLLEYGEFTPIYTDATVLARYMRNLSILLKPTIDRLWNSTVIEYNPLDNVNYTQTREKTQENTIDKLGGESETGSGNKNKSYTGGYAENEQNSGSIQYNGSESDQEGERTVEHRIAADNTETYHSSTKDIDSGALTTHTYSEGRSDNSTSQNNKTFTYNNRADSETSSDSKQRQFVDRRDIEAGTTEESVSVKGLRPNIRATSSAQALLEDERRISHYNFYMDAACIYAKYLLILVY